MNQAPGRPSLQHVAGTLLIEARAAFLNGAGLGSGEDRTTTVHKSFREGQRSVPYVSAQAWRRWLRNTLIEETGWPTSEIRAIAWNAQGNTSKVAGQVNPIDYAEDDLFGYMRAAEGQGRRLSAGEAAVGVAEDRRELPRDGAPGELRGVVAPELPVDREDAVRLGDEHRAPAIPIYFQHHRWERTHEAPASAPEKPPRRMPSTTAERTRSFRSSMP